MVKKLTWKQREVLQMSSEGKTLDSIARRLSLSPNTISARVRAAYRRLDVNSLPHACSVAILRGEIPGPLVCGGHE